MLASKRNYATCIVLLISYKYCDKKYLVILNTCCYSRDNWPYHIATIRLILFHISKIWFVATYVRFLKDHKMLPSFKTRGTISFVHQKIYHGGLPMKCAHLLALKECPKNLSVTFR